MPTTTHTIDHTTRNTANPKTVLCVAIPSPLRRVFNYISNPETDSSTLQAGMRLALPFGHQKSIVGILINTEISVDANTAHANTSNSTRQQKPKKTIKLRAIHEVLDQQASLTPDILALCQWCSDYYHYPLGEVCHLALPAILRKTISAPQRQEKECWQLTEAGKAYDESLLKRAKKQLEAWQLFKKHPLMTTEIAKQVSLSRPTINALIKKNIIETTSYDTQKTAFADKHKTLINQELRLNHEQTQALDAIQIDTFKPYLLDGVTGSGKTEIYLQAIKKTLLAGKQALVLVPEIGLTPQTLQRFQQRFNVPIAALHSGISDKQRYGIWLDAKEGRTPIIIGTRSAIFTPLAKLGLIIVDEEHDLSYKQQDGVRYSARDLAIVRAQQKNIPIILGSATSSLETLHNALSGRFTHLILRERATSATLPKIRCIDSQNEQLSNDIIAEIKTTLDKQQQALVFINRRGYAPTLICQDCGWISQCNNCDSRMTLHQPKSHQPRLHCHQCDSKTYVPKQCPQCHSARLQPLGQGTQRSEQQLASLFKHVPILRIDRDSISRKGELEAALDIINSQQPCILVGTQMLAKGHHFSNVTLAVILGLDNSFFSSDFRGSERMGQLLTQVAGRAGRESHQGTVLLQTQFSDHPLLRQLIDHGYAALAQQLLAERQLSDMPPYQYIALVRCHAQHPSMAMQFLQQARHHGEQIQAPSLSLQYLGPMPAIIEKRNNRYYYQLQIKAKTRNELHTLLKQLCPLLEKQKAPKGLHWLIDVDAQEL